MVLGDQAIRSTSQSGEDPIHTMKTQVWIGAGEDRLKSCGKTGLEKSDGRCFFNLVSALMADPCFMTLVFSSEQAALSSPVVRGGGAFVTPSSFLGKGFVLTACA